jgi:hypothetical protein
MQAKVLSGGGVSGVDCEAILGEKGTNHLRLDLRK